MRLTITQEKFIEILRLAKEYDLAHTVETGGQQITHTTLEQEIEEANQDSPSNRAHQALKDAIDALSPDEKYEVKALAWLGRNDTGETWDEHMSNARSQGPEGIGAYLSDKLPLARYLSEGLARAFLRK